jgi:hypothetical protein
MPKAGRRRLPGNREPNGRVQRPSTVAYWQRERDALRTLSRQPEWETPFGILYRADRLTAVEFEAARRFAMARRAADLALGIPPRSARAACMELTKGQPSCDPPDAEQRRRAAVDALDRAEAALGGPQSPALRACLWIVVYERQPDGYQQVLDLKAGLQTLARHMGLTGRSK